LEITDDELTLILGIKGLKEKLGKIYPITNDKLRLNLPGIVIEFKYSSISKIEEGHTLEIIYLYPIDTDEWQLYLEVPNSFFMIVYLMLLKCLFQSQPLKYIHNQIKYCDRYEIVI
jgi:hypothetical protein